MFLNELNGAGEGNAIFRPISPIFRLIPGFIFRRSESIFRSICVSIYSIFWF